MKKILICTLLGLGMSMASCSDSFFELYPDDAVATEATFQTKDDFITALNGCYAKLQTQQDFYTEMCEWRSDNLSLNAPTAGTQDRYDLDKFREVSSNAIIDDLFANFNNGIHRCNTLLDRIDGADFSDEDKAVIKGQALFLRAYTWFNMYRAWGPVVLANHVVTATESLSMGRATEAEMQNAIIGDLKAIVDGNMLPESYKGADVGSVTMGAAKAMLAKVYLTVRQPQAAADLLASLIGKYELQNDILDVFDVAKPFNSEVIWSICYDKTQPGEGHGAWFGLTNLTSEDHRTPAFNALYTADDKRAEAVRYVEVPGVKVCLIRKLYDTPDESTTKYGNNFIVLRYADVLLMYAEALNEVGYNGSLSSPALAALNEVHVRAGLNPIDITDVPDKDAFRHAVLVERQKEFPYEGHRWFDAIRLGAIQEVAANEGVSIQDYQKLFPYPSKELQRVANESLVWQNPGY